MKLPFPFSLSLIIQLFSRSLDNLTSIVKGIDLGLFSSV